MTYLERYLNGEYEQVWDELMQLGADVRQEPVYTDALSVARETMRRVRRNIETLIERLPHRGYIFGYDHRVQPIEGSTFFDKQRDYLEMLAWIRTQPPIFLSANYMDEAYAEDEKYVFDLSPMFRYNIDTPEDVEEWKRSLPDGWTWPVRMSTYVDEIERTIGPVPLSVRAWYEIVGAVNFFGYHPQWDEIALSFDPLLPILRKSRWSSSLMRECDPLQVRPLDENVLLRMQKQRSSDKPFCIFEFADDRVEKDYGHSAGTPYAFSFPDEHADQVLAPLRYGDMEGPTFVEYLRFSLKWAGFPVLADWRPQPKEDLEFLTRDLLPF
ncbi:hypothetical protein [Ktedonospora formicarum]|uniref:Uncharacterized protein n=1 Tax=Ktedonospora formicarum TaxID=2778364 RepID=A0A8J3MVM6_9CHLR|nr:hypothetical protein [Ktedonospora formicarum]GHO49495.1 hypothetical protein KSX_76580 [Ktedonospora formicarum]